MTYLAPPPQLIVCSVTSSQCSLILKFLHSLYVSLELMAMDICTVTYISGLACAIIGLFLKGIQPLQYARR